MTETELIKILTRGVPRKHGNLVTGIGDDCSIVRMGKKDILVSVDSLIEGIHFPSSPRRKPGSRHWKMWGKKAAAVSLSDIAAMGGKPLFAWIDLSIPKNLSKKNIRDFYRGFLEMLKKHKTVVAGGNISRSPKNFAASVTVMGEVPKGKAMLRSNAKPGETVFISGPVGGDFLRPIPHIKMGQKIRKAGCRCCIDVSDGLLKDLDHVAQASKVKIRLYADRIPHKGPLKKALTRGEDYVLAFTDKLGTRYQVPGTPIGTVIKGKPGIEVVDKNGKLLSFSKLGFEHTVANLS
ncbi:MAG: thiamine-phosphate kinase [Deltaproteobacteria bacterium]|nr:thiamine-phosphate kinase [Deltaproteobacteria bacterium]